MGTYEKVMAEYKGVADNGIALQVAMNEAFAMAVVKLLEKEGYKIKGIISIYPDYNIPFLWHIVDRTHYHNFSLEYIFNAKKETISHKFEEVG